MDSAWDRLRNINNLQPPKLAVSQRCLHHNLVHVVRRNADAVSHERVQDHRRADLLAVVRSLACRGALREGSQQVPVGSWNRRGIQRRSSRFLPGRLLAVCGYFIHVWLCGPSYRLGLSSLQTSRTAAVIWRQLQQSISRNLVKVCCTKMFWGTGQFWTPVDNSWKNFAS